LYLVKFQTLCVYGVSRNPRGEVASILWEGRCDHRCL
jgi:hypothetical protein